MAQKQSLQDVLTIALNDINAGRIGKASKTVDRVLAKYPNETDALQVKAMVHRARGQTRQAITVLEKGLAIRPGAVGLTTLYGSILGEAGHFTKALDVFQQVQNSGQPVPPGVPYNISLMLLTLGRFEEALPLFEARLGDPGFRHTVTDQLPRWQGEDLTGKHLLVTGEQGLGDQVLFAALLQEAALRAAKLTVTSNPRLSPLFQRSFPAVSCVPHSEAGPEFGLMPEQPDLYCPAGSLALHLSPSLLGERPKAAYLKPDPERVDALRHKYQAQAGDRPIIGVSWSSPRAYLSAAKTMPADVFGSLFSDQEVCLVNLQYRAERSDIAALKRSSGKDVILDETVDPEQDMDGVAAQCAAVDHVVSVSTSVVHIAGAVGADTTVLLPKGVGSLWYWSDAAGLKPWYQSVQVRRQTEPGEWSSMIKALAVQPPWIRKTPS